MEVHSQLGAGFLEVIYKEALEYEFYLAGIPYEREKRYQVTYKDVVLQRQYQADFVVFDSIILEVKGVPFITNIFIAQCINYLKVSGNRLAILVNFGEERLSYKRIVL